jgi:hypothetical protein
MRWIVLPLCLCTLACRSQDSAYSEITLRGDAIAQEIQTALQGAKGEFHADRVDADGTRHPACFLQLSSSLGDRRFEFSLPDRVVDLGYLGQLSYKVGDIELKSIDVTSDAGSFALKVGFVSKGVTLRGSHNWLGDAAVPDINLDHMQLIVRLKPVVTAEGKITYDEPRVQFTASVDNTFIPRFSILGATIDVVDSLTNYRRDLCQSIQKQIQKALDDPARKATLAKKLEDGISGEITGPKSAIVGLRFQGTDLVVRLRR